MTLVKVLEKINNFILSFKTILNQNKLLVNSNFKYLYKTLVKNGLTVFLGGITRIIALGASWYSCLYELFIDPSPTIPMFIVLSFAPVVAAI